MEYMNPEPNPLLLQAIHQRVEIQPYDPEWPAQFALERDRLLQLFPETFIAIEHFGVESMRVADEILNPLCEAGYDTSKEFNAKLKDRRWLMLHANGKRTHHLHLVIHGQKDWQINLAFRDALRADTELASRYEIVKRNLAAIHAGDREAYTAAKGDFIKSVVGE
jgi:GrpB-like predicted nucleotidyltransferase (UPF0157 family)